MHTMTAETAARFAEPARRKERGNAVTEKQTYLTDDELEDFRQLLVEMRRRMLGDYNDLTDDVAEMSQPEKSGAQSIQPTHPADLGTDEYEEGLSMRLAENQRGILLEIEEALRRIDNGTYGICMGTGQPISKERLRIKPWARYTVDYARQVQGE